MTSKNWYFSLAKEDLKRRVWLIALTSLILFFSYPVLTILYAGAVDGYSNYQYGLSQYQLRMEALLSLKNLWMFMVVTVSAIIYAISGFSYLNSKSKADFYHSIPVRREKLFLVHFINGFILMALLYLIFAGLALILGVANGADLSKMMKPAVTAYAVNLSFFLLIYSAAVVAVMMTGNRIVTLLGIGVFFFYMPIMGALMEGFCSEWLITYYSNGGFFLQSSKISPLLLYTHSVSQKNPLSYVPAAVAAGIVLSAIALWLYQKRPSEGAGKSLVFPASKPVIRIAIVLCSALTGAIFGWSIRGTLTWSVFFLLCGGVVSHCVIEIIYHLDFRKLFSNLPQLIGCMVVSILVIVGFRYDLFGYDKYVPAAAKMASVSIDPSGFDNWVVYGELTDEYGYGLDYGWVDSTSYLFGQMKVKDTALAAELAAIGSQEAVAARKTQFSKGYNRLYGFNNNRAEDGETYMAVMMQFHMQGGRKIARRYVIPMSRFEDKLAALYEMEEFKTALYPIFSQQKDLSYVHFVQYGFSQELWRGDSAGAQALREAYRQDLLEQTIAVRKTEDVIASLRFVTADEEQQVQMQELEGNNWVRERVIWNNQYPVYPSFSRTIACLSEAGVELPEQLDVMKITGGQICLYRSEFANDESAAETSKYESDYCYLDLTAEEIESLLPYLVSDECSNWNSLRPLDYRAEVVVNVNWKPPYNTIRARREPESNLRFFFYKDQMSEEIMKKIESIL